MNIKNGSKTAMFFDLLGIKETSLCKAFAFTSELEQDQEKIIKTWKEGLNGCDDSEENSYYFLGEFVNFNKPFRKDKGIKKGRGKGWVAAQISKNRCIPFKEFIRRMDDR